MTAKERKLFEQRIGVFLKRLKTLFYENELPLQIEYCVFNPNVQFKNRLDGKYKPISKGGAWGKNWDRGWFHLQGKVPPDWKGKRIIARINLGGEALVFTKDGVPLAGLSVHSLWQQEEFNRDRIELFESANGGEKIDLWVEASAGQLFGLVLEEDYGALRPEFYGNYQAAVGDVYLAVFRKDIWEFYLDCFVLNDLMLALPERSVRRARILNALMKAIDSFREDRQGVQIAQQFLIPELKKSASSSELTTRAVGHAHLDTAWLWPLEETIRKCARTFSSQVAMIEKYPGFVFGASQAQLYAFTKENYPELYQKIKEKVQQGRWEIQGGMWVEADCNIISGESMVRQILHGKNFFMDEFGVDVKNLWLPDVFGYSAAMPQILKKSGIEYFITQKLSWNQFNKLPSHSFVWRGIDSSEVITHFPPEDDYNSLLKPSRLKYAQENFSERAYLDEFLTLFGIGDGGCGPTEEIIETGLRQKNLENCPRVEFGTAQTMLDRLGLKKEKLPRWVGELYLECHRGTLTTHAYIKRMNRYMELKLRELEIIYSMLTFDKYPQQQLDEMWKKTLLFQFHDIIPGSSITPVYDQCRRDYEEMKNLMIELLANAGKLLLKIEKNSLCLFNSLSTNFNNPIELPESWIDYSVEDENGNPVASQTEENKTVIQMDIPPLTWVTIKKGNEIAQVNKLDKPKKMVLENDLIRYEFTSEGRIKSAFDKECDKQVIAENGFGNVFNLFEDRPANWDAWDIDIFYENQLLQQAELVEQEWICADQVRQGIRQQFKVGDSTISQNVYLANHTKRLDFETKVDWLELHKMLRVSFAVNIISDFASFEIQYGFVRRNTHRNTSWDMAKFEAAGHRFADLSDKEYGAALLNDCKYGYKVLDNVIDLNLLRSTTMPDPAADQGEHTFTYSFLPHNKELIYSDVISEAARLNQKPAVLDGYTSYGLRFPFSLDGKDVILEVVKKSEKEAATILRLYEPRGKTASAGLVLNNSYSKVFETDLMENNLEELKIENGEVKLQFAPFEIKTVKVVF